MIGFELVDRPIGDLIQAYIVADEGLEVCGALGIAWLLSRGLQRLSSILWAGARLQKRNHGRSDAEWTQIPADAGNGLLLDTTPLAAR